MPDSTLINLTKDGKRNGHQNFIFSKYAPLAPHNTTQYIIEENNSRGETDPFLSIYLQ